MSDRSMSAEEYVATVGKPKVSKYHNVKTEVDGILFDSKAEARRYGELMLMRAAGEITFIELQPKFLLEVNRVKICTYIGDFRYRVVGTHVDVIEDTKGVRTPAYKLKKKLMKAIHNIDITEVNR